MDESAGSTCGVPLSDILAEAVRSQMIIPRLLRRTGPALVVVGVVAGVLVVPPAHADASTWTVSAPRSGPMAVVRHDIATGTVTLAVTRGGRTVLEPGPVGIVTERADLSRGLRLVGRATQRSSSATAPPSASA